MNYAMLLRQLHREILQNKHAEKKHIIRFRNPSEFHKCIAQWKQLKSSLVKLSALQPIQMIHSFCCTLRSYRVFAKYRHIFTIEEDVKVQIHYRNNGVKGRPFIPWGVQEIHAPKVWNVASGKKVKIGVIDTGADFSHPDLRSSLAGGINFVQRHMPPYDDNGHGTHITGTIAANNRSNGIIGVAPKASIYAVKAFDRNGSAFVSDIILGIDWCVRHRMNIINMSFGMKSCSPSLRDAVRSAYAAGIIIVASSGNDGKKSGIDYPARLAQTIAVGATNQKREIASFSNCGKGINIYAPGENIVSTWINHGYHELSGTSMATSHVTGAIALLLSQKPRLTMARIKSLLKKSAVPLKNVKKNGTVPGELNIARAIQMCKK